MAASLHDLLLANRVDADQTGFISLEDFMQILSSRDLGLQLVENELLYIVSQVKSEPYLANVE